MPSTGSLIASTNSSSILLGIRQGGVRWADTSGSQIQGQDEAADFGGGVFVAGVGGWQLGECPVNRGANHRLALALICWWQYSFEYFNYIYLLLSWYSF